VGLASHQGGTWTQILEHSLGLDGLLPLDTARPPKNGQNPATIPEHRPQMELIFDYQLDMVNLAIHAGQKIRLARVLYTTTKPGNKIGDEQGTPEFL
jgi:hypothetical protein